MLFGASKLCWLCFITSVDTPLRMCLGCVQVFTTDQQLAFELQGSSFKLVVGTLQVRMDTAKKV